MRGRERTTRIPLYVRCVVAVLPLIAIWSLATPLGAAPDEPSQVVAAAALVRGQVLPHESHTEIGYLANVDVPQWAASSSALPSCYAFHPEISARCTSHLTSSTATAPTLTQFTRYPPPYYAIVGTATLAFTGTHAFWAGRAITALLAGLLLGVGLEMLLRWHRRRAAALVGAALALPPMALFLMSAISPSAIEVSAAFATVCGLVCLADGPIPPSRALCARVAMAATALAWSRPLSVAYLAVFVLACALIKGRRGVVDLVRAAPRWSVAIPATAVLAVGAWLLVAGQPHLIGNPPPHQPLSGELRTTLTRTGLMLREQIGMFGWLDTPAPLLTVVVWTLALGALLTTALLRAAGPREVAAWTLPLVVMLLLPVVLEAPRLNQVGVFWQGRYSLPVSLAVPLIAATRPGVADAIDGVQRRAATLLAFAWATGQIAAFVETWHRYSSGFGGPWLPLHPAWQPPGGYVTIAAFCLVVALLALVGRAEAGRAAALRPSLLDDDPSGRDNATPQGPP